MTLIRYNDDDRRRMRTEAAEQAETLAELDRLSAEYAGIAYRPTTPAEIERERKLAQVRERLHMRPLGAPGS